MRFFRQICLILCVILLLQCYTAPVLAEEETTDVSVLSGCRGIDSSVPFFGTAQVTENAQSIVVYEVNTGTLMYTWNPDQQLHPAGMVKILTALLVLENGNLSDAVTVKESVLETVSSDARTSDLQPDEVLTVEQLLYCVLVGGSNDAAAIVAHHVAGSQEAFVAMMNAYATEIGCTGSHFTNVHGLHDEQQLSTARDIARILDAAIQNEKFAELFSTTHYTVEKTNKSEARDLESSNHMLHQGMYEIYYDERVTGGRTGVNNTGLCCLATTAQQDDLQLICVVLGSESVVNDYGIVEKIGGFQETKELLDLGFSGVKTAQLLYKNQALKQYDVRNGISDVIVGPYVVISSVIPQDASADSLIYKYHDVDGAFEAPVERGQHVSTVEIWSGNVCVAQADLYALNSVAVNYQQVEVKDNSGLSGWAILLIVLLILIALFTAIVFVIRFQNIQRRNSAKRRMMRRRTERRRDE